MLPNFKLFSKNRKKSTLTKDYNRFDSTNGFIGGLIAPLVVSIAFVVLLIFVSIFAGIGYEELVENKVVTILSIIVGQLSFIAFIFWYNKREGKKFTKAFKFKKINILILLLSLALGVIVLFGTNDFVYLTDALLRVIGYSKSTDLPFSMDSVGNLILGLITMALLPAVVEELMFRGMILGGLLKSKDDKKGKVVAVVISAVIFALIHGSAQQFVFPFIMGIVFGSVYLFTGNLWYTIAMHFCNNGLVVVLNYISTINGVTAEALTINFGYVLTAIGFMLVTCALFVGISYLIYRIANKSADLRQSEQEGVEIISEEVASEVLVETINETQADIRADKVKLWACYIYAIGSIIVDVIMYLG